MILKRHKGKLMLIERHFWVLFFVMLGVIMTAMILSMQFADARSESEPTCYSQACKKAQLENGTATTTASEIERSEENVQLEIHDTLKETKILIEETEEKIVELVENMSEYNMTMQESENSIKPALNELNSWKHVVKKLRDEYKDAFAEATSSGG